MSDHRDIGGSRTPTRSRALRELGMQAVVAMPFDLDALIGIVQRYTPSSATQTVTETGGNDCRRNYRT